MILLENISKQYQQIPVLHSVNLSVRKGNSYVILGQSGSGKTTLLKIISGLILPDEGRVRVETENIGMLFQRNALFDSMTVEENLDFPLREKTKFKANQRRELITQFLSWLELSGKENLYPSEMSGGMQKRLSIARTLILKPEVILYDEPTAGLDPITSRLIADLILKLKKEMDLTLIIVTSDIMRAFQLGNFLGLLMREHGTNQGYSLKDIGTPEMAKESSDPFVRQFIHGKPR